VFLDAVQTFNHRIPAYSRRQAMDWSLVLLSQEIESVIDYAEEGGGWGLLVAPEDYERALAAIRLYRAENRRWLWRREMFRPGLVFDWAALGWVLLVLFFFWISGEYPAVKNTGAVDSTVVWQQPWRLFTAVWLHADAAHLGTNATIGLVLLGLALGGWGTGAGLLAAYLAGVGGNVLAVVLSRMPHHSLGASGMVMGALGLLAAQSLAVGSLGPRPIRSAVMGLAAGLMLFVLMGLTPGTDIVAHLGGFLGGLILGTFLTLIPQPAQRTGLNLACGLVFVLLVVWPWWLAFVQASQRGG
jgi:membrane associated rhomboid family serine protease